MDTYHFNTYDDFEIKSVKLEDYGIDGDEVIICLI